MNVITKIFNFVKHEFLEVLPPTLYFLIAFHIILFNTQVILSEFGVDLDVTLRVTIIALVIGKVVLVVNKMPVLRKLDTKPLLIPILFKSFIYTFFVVVVRLLEVWIPAYVGSWDASAANQHLGDHYVWRLFIAANLWTFICFVIYTTAVEMIRLFGFTKRELARAFLREHPAHMAPGSLTTEEAKI